jgi:preprotein translocase subunit SecG
MNLLINLFLALYVIVALFMMLVILMQRPKSEGLGAAFGGGVTENIFGAQTTNVLVKFTAWMAGIFFALTFALSILYAHKNTADSAFRRELMKTQAAPQGSPSHAPTSAQISPSPAAAQSSPVSSATQAGSERSSGQVAGSPAVSVPPIPTPSATAKPKR